MAIGTYIGGSNLSYLITKLKGLFETKGACYPKTQTYSKSEVDAKISQIDTSAYATKEELDAKTQQATSTKAGIMKLYDVVGIQTDGAITPSALKSVAEAANEDIEAERDARSQADSAINALLTAVNDKLTLAEARGYHAPGEIFTFAGKSDTKPTRSLICDGSEKSRTEFADLFAAVGTTYGAGDGSTTFNLPNLIDCYNDDGTINENATGVFLRPAASDEDVGKKEQDAIRDITGALVFRGLQNSNTGLVVNGFEREGALDCTSERWAGNHGGLDFTVTSQCYIDKVLFDANRNGSNNPMARHAAGSDIRPYSIKVIYLIAY